MTQPLLTIKQVAAYLAVSVRTLERELAAGAFPKPVRIGRLRRWRQEDIDRHLENTLKVSQR